MKVEIKNPESQKEEIKFPCLMYSKTESTGNIQIILATGYDGLDESNLVGMKISYNDGEDWPLGDYSAIWTAKDFKPFEGSITLSND